MNEPNTPAVRGPLDAPVVPMVERTWRTALLERLDRRVLMKHAGTGDPWRDHWNLTEADSELHRDAAHEIRAMLAQLGAAPRWWTCKTHGDSLPHNAWGCPNCVTELRDENALLRKALDEIAERTSSDDPCRSLVQIARDALRHNGPHERGV